MTGYDLETPGKNLDLNIACLSTFTAELRRSMIRTNGLTLRSVSQHAVLVSSTALFVHCGVSMIVPTRMYITLPYQKFIS